MRPWLRRQRFATRCSWKPLTCALRSGRELVLCSAGAAGRPEMPVDARCMLIASARGAQQNKGRGTLAHTPASNLDAPRRDG